MVQQLFNDLEKLKAEVRRLRGQLQNIAIGGSLLPGVVPGTPNLPNPIAGAIIRGSSVPDWQRLAIGAEGDVLTVDTGMPEWRPATGGTITSSGGMGLDGEPGEEGPMGPPGPVGPSGAAGVTGPIGPAGFMFWMESDDPEEAMPIPGPVGPTGATGATGPAGSGSGSTMPLWTPDQADRDEPELWFPPAVTANWDFRHVRVISTAAASTYNVNSTSYVTQIPLEFNIDLDYYPFSDFRIIVSGNSNQVGQSVTLQLALFATPGTPVSAAGNDLVINNAGALYDSGWIGRADGRTGSVAYMVCTKGSNTTVDLVATYIDVLLRRKLRV